MTWRRRAGRGTRRRLIESIRSEASVTLPADAPPHRRRITQPLAAASAGRRTEGETLRGKNRSGQDGSAFVPAAVSRAALDCCD